MAPSPNNTGIHRFGAYEFGSRAGELRKRGIRIRLEGQPVAILAMLLARPGDLVTREELQKKLWPADTFVDFEHSLNAAIKRLRAALADSANAPRYVETVSRKGYRFIAPVAQPSGAPPKQAAPAAAAALVVLPLANLSGDSQQEYFSDGLTEELITQLARLSPTELAVIARTTAMRYKGTRKSVAEIGRELGVDYVIEGSARHDRGRVRIAVQLIRAADEMHVWAESYDRSFADILPMQSEIARAVTEAIRLKLVRNVSASSRVDPEVYDAYLQARYLEDQRTALTTKSAIQFYEKALQRDPRYAPAWAGLARCRAILPLTADARPREVFPQATEAALRALQLDPTFAGGHLARGIVHFWFDWDWSAAEREFRRAMELDPSDSQSRMFLAHVHSNVCRHDEAIEEIRSALRFDPFSMINNALEGQFLYNARRYDEAVERLRRALELAPHFWIAHLMLGKTLGAGKKNREALKEFAHAYRDSNGNSFPLALRGFTLGNSGHPASARRVLRDLERQSRQRYIPPSHRALVCTGLSERKAALDILDQALEERDVHLSFLAVEPRWNSLRTLPRFQKLFRSVGLPNQTAQSP